VVFSSAGLWTGSEWGLVWDSGDDGGFEAEDDYLCEFHSGSDGCGRDWLGNFFCVDGWSEYWNRPRSAPVRVGVWNWFGSLVQV